MARIIRKGYQLEEEYYAIKHEQADKRAKNIRTLGKVTFAFFMIYVVSIAVIAVTGIFSSVFVPLSACFVGVQLIVVFVCLGGK